MSQTIAEFLASIGFEADEASLQRALTKVAGFVAAVKLAATGITAAIVRVAQAQADIGSQAFRLGSTVERLEEMRYVAVQTGAGVGALDESLESLGRRYPHIRDTTALLDRMGRAMAGMTEAQQRAYARKMGIDPSLIPMMTRDVRSLREEYRQMYELAGTNAREATEASKGFLAELGKLRSLAEMLVKAVSLAFIGRVRNDVERLRRGVQDNFKKIKLVLEWIVRAALHISDVIGAMLSRAIKWGEQISDWYESLDKGQRKVVVGIGLLIAAWRLLGIAFLTSPVTWALAALGALLLLLDDYQTYMEGGKSYFDWGPWAETIQQVARAIKTATREVLKFISTHPKLTMALATIMAGMLKYPVGSLTLLTRLGSVIGPALLSGIKSATPALLAGLRGLGRAMVAGVRGIGTLVAGAAKAIGPALLGIGKAIRAATLLLVSNPYVALLAGIAAVALLVITNWDKVKEVLGQVMEYLAGKVAGFLAKIEEAKKKVAGLIDTGSRTLSEAGEGAKMMFTDLWDALRTAHLPDDYAMATGPGPALAAAHAQTSGALGGPPRLVPGGGKPGNTNNTNNVSMQQKIEIQIQTSDPVAAGNQAAARIEHSAADLQRNMQGRVK